MLKHKKVAILIAARFHEEETTSPRHFLESKGTGVDYVGLERKQISGKAGRLNLTPEKSIDQIDVSDYDALVIPGGGAPERIRLNDKAVEFVHRFWASGKPVAAICHGPQVLISAGVLSGMKLTCYAGIRDDVKLAGADYVDQPLCVDGQLITSRKPDDLDQFNQAIADALAGSSGTTDLGELDALTALQIAISREKGAREFYLKVAKAVEKESVGNRFHYLADVEQDHFDQLSEFYKKLTGKSPKVDMKYAEIKGSTVSKEITAEKALDLAMDAEQKAYEFYHQAANKAKSDSAKEMFDYLAGEEMEHKRLLSMDKASLPGGQGHFQWATHWDTPPGMEDLW